MTRKPLREFGSSLKGLKEDTNKLDASGSPIPVLLIEAGFDEGFGRIAVAIVGGERWQGVASRYGDEQRLGVNAVPFYCRREICSFHCCRVFLVI